VIIAVLVCLAAFVVTRHRGYLRLAWQIIKFSAVIAIAAALFFLITRIILL
jgi:hypothetical protein